ncbi:hypothetical protein [Fodinicola feengrottensis]|uniref:hypothetical protein n=1 Tax=Fodinicola feengrottensis TaxID=435914 RepID=UPI0013D30F37|nr:hypothetical protein [Fodinicola feengrottensis]
MSALVGTAATAARLQRTALWPWAIRVWATELGPREIDGRAGGPVPVSDGWYGSVGTVPVELFEWRQPVLAGRDDWAAAIGPRPADWLSMMSVVAHLARPAGQFRLGIRYVGPELVDQGLPSNQHFKLAEADQDGARLLALPAVRSALAPVSTDFVTLADRAVLVHIPLRDRTADQLARRQDRPGRRARSRPGDRGPPGRPDRARRLILRSSLNRPAGRQNATRA